MNDLRQAAQQALEMLEELWHLGLEDTSETQHKAAIDDLRAALAEPQTTHWEGCEAVHPECKTEPLAAWENKYGMKEWQVHAIRAGWMPAPTPRKPLTDEEMRECAQAMNAEPLAEGWPELIKFARAIERAHGIGDSNAT